MFDNYFQKSAMIDLKKQNALLAFDMKCHPVPIHDRCFNDVLIYKMQWRKYMTCPLCRDYRYNPYTKKAHSLMKPIKDREAPHNYQCLKCGQKFMIVSSTDGHDFSLKDDGLPSLVLPSADKTIKEK